MTRSLRIAIADDELDTREHFAAVLPLLGHEVVGIASNGRELVQLAEELQPELIISDVKMPEMDGIEAADAICSQRIVPVILISAFHERELVQRAAERRVLAYLVKPVKKADLEAAIAIVIRRFDEFQSLRKEAADAKQALEDRKLIERAKGMLMKRADLQEDEAFRRLQKLARSRNKKLVEVAEMILAADEILG